MKDNFENLFCGSTDVYPADTQFQPKSILWSSHELIGQIQRNDIRLDSNMISEMKDGLWNDLCSEYDAENFCNYLKTSGIKLSSDFKSFEYVWRRDELNHYLGFRQIYSLLYDISEDEITREVKSRTVNFEPLKSMLQDEFKICLLIAYDEIATTKNYASEYEFYTSFGPINFLRWVKNVTRDEAYHFNNCMELIGKNFKNRISEIPKLVDYFIDWDLNGGAYHGTFVLDHDGPYFTNEVLNACGDTMKNYFFRK